MVKLNENRKLKQVLLSALCSSSRVVPDSTGTGELVVEGEGAGLEGVAEEEEADLVGEETGEDDQHLPGWLSWSHLGAVSANG